MGNHQMNKKRSEKRKENVAVKKAAFQINSHSFIIFAHMNKYKHALDSAQVPRLRAINV